jgi:hypothetical protein
MVKSFMSGILARDLTVRAQVGQTEVAFLCSMFHDLGTNLTIYYFPEEYERIKGLVSGNGKDIQSAARSVLGISFDELGVGVARVWKFPESIVYCMRGLPGGPVEKPASPLDLLRHFSVFSNELCRLAGSGLPENRGEPLSRLVQRFQGSFSLSEPEALALLRSAVDTVETYASILNIAPERSPFIQGFRGFFEAEEPHDAAGSASRSIHASEWSQKEACSVGRNAALADEEHGPAETGSSHQSEEYAPSVRIWGRVLRLPHKLGLTRQ